MVFAIISHASCALHSGGPMHPEQPARVQVIDKALKAYPFSITPQFYEAKPVTREDLLLTHSPAYVDSLFEQSPKSGIVMLDGDTFMNPHTLNAALLAAGAVCMAVDMVLGNKQQIVFCNIRPPGHHAESELAMGFCFFNNVAVGVNYAFAHYPIKRIAIVDFDVHHGNGTQQIFQQDPRVLLCSSFQHPFYPGYNPANDNDHIISVPLMNGTTGDVYRQKVQAAWFARLRAFQPQLIFFSAGFDAHIDDPLANISLTESDYVWLSAQVAKIARECCEGKMISVLEGGYHLPALETCVPAHLEALLPQEE